MHDRHMFDWGYQTDPEPNLNNRRIEAMRGKVLGGSSSINVMAYTRGNPGDYDRWAQKGARGWSYADVLPYFRRCETFARGEDAWRGGTGPLGTEFARTQDPLYEAWLEAAKSCSYPLTSDYNGEQQEGFGRGQYTIRDGRRSSSANAFLKPASGRKNLTVATNAHTTRVVLDGTRARGIEYVQAGSTLRASATREVILAAGTFNTPQILMLSGIGPAQHLRDFGIGVVADLPVGKNLQDHLGAYMTYTRKQPGSFHREMRVDRMAASMIRAHLFGRGPATVVPGGLHAFIKTRPELAVPDIEFMFRGTSHAPHLWFPFVRPAFQDGYGIRPTLLHPDSRGEVLLSTADPLAPPRIVYRFFTAPNDLPTLREGFKRARELAFDKALNPYRGEEIGPGLNVKTDAEIDGWLKKVVITAHHPCGTCAMGQDGVLDADLRSPRHREFARLRRLGVARSRLRPHQCLRADDGRKGRRPYSWPQVLVASGGGLTVSRTKNMSLRRLAVILAIVAVVPVLVPYALAPLYRFIDPVSMPMLWRYATGARVERIDVPLARTSPALRLAVIVAEDGGFCHNPGIDLGEIRAALRQSHDDLDESRGASTITQQTAKNLFLWQGRSFIRKALEMPLAVWMTLVLPKRRILEIYLNIAEWGPDGMFGAEAGARWAFGKSAHDLTPYEAAELAAILPNPVRRSTKTPSVLVRRLAGLYERRAAEFSGLDACVRGP